MTGLDKDDLQEVALAHDIPAGVLVDVIELERSPSRKGRGGINSRLRTAIDAHRTGERSGNDLPAIQADALVIESVLLHNFRAYAEDVLFTPSTSEDAPISLVIAANGHGKSSLIAALYWVLHLDKSQGDLFRYPAKLLHLGATGAQAELRVEVRFHSRRYDYLEVRRKVEFRRVHGSEPKVTAEQLDVVFQVDGDVSDLHDKDAREWLAQRFPPEVIRYFIFDAENSPVGDISGQLGETMPMIRTQVEAVLGLQTLREASKRCKQHAVEYWKKDADKQDPEAEIRQATADMDETRRLIQEIDDKVSRHEADKTAADEAQQHIDEELRQVRQQLGQYDNPDDIQTRSKRLAQLRKDEGHLESQLLRSWHEDLPLALLSTVLQQRAAAAPPPTRSSEWTAGARFALDRVANLAAKGAIPWMKPPHPSHDDARDWISEQLPGLGVSPTDTSVPWSRWADQGLAARGRIQPGIGKRLNRLRQQLQDDAHLPRQSRVPPDALVGQDLALDEDRQLQLMRRQQATSQIDAAGMEREGLIDCVSEYKARIKKLSLRKAKARDARKKSLYAARLHDALHDLIKRTIQARLDTVETEASRVLQMVTNKPDELHSIRFDRDTLRFQILDPNGRVAPPDQSTGERTVIALAILSGLQAAGDLIFPQVIEAPLRPLDHDHADKVVRKVLAHPRHQSILLEVPGRLDGDLRGALQDRLGLVLRIEHSNQKSWFVETPLGGRSGD